MTFFSEIKQGLIKGDDENMYPSRLHGHKGGRSEFTDPSNTIFGLVLDGEVELTRPDQSKFTLRKHTYFANPGAFTLTGAGSAVLFERKGYRGLFQIGGPVEAEGRLVYIDTCRASVLVSPPRLGDPCLNLLTFPPEVEQSRHIHPTIRMGAVLAGRGTCLFGNGQSFELSPGKIFYLAEAVPHCFHSGREPMVVVAYHPDSDVGPTDASHPMMSRTLKI